MDLHDCALNDLLALTNVTLLVFGWHSFGGWVLQGPRSSVAAEQPGRSTRTRQL
jgi:hypothetical protein